MNIKYNKDTIIRICILLTIVIYIIVAYPKYDPFPKLTGVMMSWMLSFYFDDAPITYKNYMILGQDNIRYGFLISPECSGLLVLLVFLFVVFVTPNIKLIHRFYSIIFIPLLFFANAVRVMSGILFGNLTTLNNISTYHATVGQILMFVFMIGSYMLFLKIFGYFNKGDAKEKGYLAQ